MHGVILILILAIMGGAIAYIGDKLGSKVGKKKLTMFGLRPKHTSIIVTIISGILITTSTLIILSISSQNVRTALFGLDELNKKIAQSSKDLIELNQDLNKINTELIKAKDDKVKIVAELEKANQEKAKALAERDKAMSQLKDLEDTKITLENKVSELNNAKEILEEEVAQYNKIIDKLSQGIKTVREGAIVYRAGEVIINGVVEGKENDNIEGSLSNLLYIANAKILDSFDVVDKNVEALWLVRGEMEQAAQAIKNSNEEVIVRVVSAGNVIYGEPVRAYLELYPNREIYKKGQSIYSQNFLVDQNTNAEELVLGYLKNVNSIATKQGILPDPIKGTIGVMTGSQFYEIVNQVETMNGNINITAVAATDTKTSGPLRLDIKITKQ